MDNCLRQISLLQLGEFLQMDSY